ncbi:MAG: PHP domain-containing protein [Bacteroidales bacterium]|nr:PHP domain-containing protein [Bacteroidales bacterium]
MQWFQADMHVHTVLSPCGGLDMSPVNIIRKAKEKKLDIIAITDHNSTKHCKSAQQIGSSYGITVIAGAEVNTEEEIHCLAFFENLDQTEKFQQFIDDKLMVIRNKPDIFGHQLVVDENEDIVEEEERLLVASLKAGIDEVAKQVALLNGIFIPAHINRPHNGIFSQLGFLPEYIRFDALEVSRMNGMKDFLKAHPETAKYCLVTNSDAHSLKQLGSSPTGFYLEEPTFQEIRMALGNINGRKVNKL